MSRAAITVSLISAAGVGLAAAIWFSPGGADLVVGGAGPGPAPGAPVARPQVVGVAGCLAAACHGGPADDTLAGRWDAGGWRSSGTCWVAADPHRGAYELLLAAERRRPDRLTAAEVVANLGTGVPAHEDARCLACHTTPALAGPAAAADPWLRGLRRDGVGCEACHGPAGGWVVEHTTWGKDRPAEYAAGGMTPLYDVGGRAVTCAGCHVGAPADPARGVPVRDVNHDMIAAGHPRLAFDFGEYHRRLSKHWGERDRVPGTNPAGDAAETRRWLVGRVAHAEAACRLLADRLERAATDDPRSPWPEFSEFDCAACHHALPGNRPGTRGHLAWQPVWPVTGGFGRPGFEAVAEILKVSLRPKLPPRTAVAAAQPAAAADRLRQQRLALVKAPDADVTRDVAKLFPDSVGPWTDWDPAGQLLHGLAAAGRDRARGGRPNPDFGPAFDALRRRPNLPWGAGRAALDALLPAAAVGP